eukprot:1136803-Pelagomonas_calceolata.AAC.17
MAVPAYWCSVAGEQDRKLAWKGCIAVPAYVGSLADAKKLPANQTSLSWRTRTDYKTQSQHFKHTDTNLANPRIG